MEKVYRYAVKGEKTAGDELILTEAACEFLAELHDVFHERQAKLLEKRGKKQRAIDAGTLPAFRKETEHIRREKWKIADIPDDIKDRRVEITGPAGNRKMVINALNSGAKVFMADFEDANSPTWENCIQGQLNMYDAVRKSINFTAGNGKNYRLRNDAAVLFVRPRGLHLKEEHFQVDGTSMYASLFDFGLYFFHNATELVSRGSGPYFYLPKLEYWEEAAYWNDIFIYAQQRLDLNNGTIKATVLIETLTAVFEADEILHALREHSAGLNCGRWDYIFSYIKKLHKHDKYILPDRSQVTMTVHFMRAYSLYVIQTCHQRGAHAMGGMAAQIPIKNDDQKNIKALQKVREDKIREVRDGHDGTWVAHPGLVPVAMAVFNEYMPAANQITRLRNDDAVQAEDLLTVPKGSITEKGLRQNIIVALRYMEAWLRGYGAVPIFHLMEDAATAEISRTQVWQWIKHPDGKLENGRKIDVNLVKQITEEELQMIKVEMNEQSFTTDELERAKALFLEMISSDELVEFMTIPAYKHLIDKGRDSC
ncbi:malate synthase [Evansella caseinilytica]|uniref:Malate synthase n=1 Tax=Evansella caseinilytica TaxID=1503961 RepID=A0A1H3NPL8_9BACI|nr:malate synthase A [Evansella caseinilytica]SDY90866.1 malate synthase [Evansella caseinilytica]